MGNILALTGASGRKSGGAFVRRLSENGELIRTLFPGGIRALLRESSDASELLSLLPDAELKRGDLRDGAYLRESLAGVDTLVHIAGIHRSVPIVKAAADCGVRRLILVHTTGIYSKYKAAGEVYRQIDATVERICRERGILLTICRPTMIYGNIHDANVVTFIRMVDRLPVMPVVKGARFALQPVHYEDLADAYYAILTNEAATANRSYVLSGGAPILLRDMLRTIGDRLGKRVRFLSCPYPVAYAGALGLFACTLGKKDYREKVQRLCEERAYPFSDAAADFGYAPRTFEVGITDEVSEYIAQRGAKKKTAKNTKTEYTTE